MGEQLKASPLIEAIFELRFADTLLANAIWTDALCALLTPSFPHRFDTTVVVTAIPPPGQPLQQPLAPP